MLWIVLWCGAVAIMHSGSMGIGMAFGIATGVVLYGIKTTKHRARLDRLRLEYEHLYGPHPGYDDRAQRYGAATGAVLGQGFGGAYLVGSLLGVGLDHLRSKQRKLLMSAEQASAYETLRRLSAYRPGAAFAVYLTWVLLGAGGDYVVGVIAGVT